jgi:predicted transglutaminase-like cysteine proteinase
VNTAIKALAVLGGLWAFVPAAAAASPPAADPPPPSPHLFGTVEFRAESLAALPQWQRTLRRIEQERSIYELCSEGSKACPSRQAIAWQAMIKSQTDRARMDQLRAVNRFLNDWRYKSDAQNYGERDYWASPLEFLSHSGDCEDYAVIKYVSLRQLGFAADQLRVVVVRDVVRDLAHAVLAVYLDDQVYILDNLTTAILPQERVSQYVPYYSINETTRWAHVPPVTTAVSSAAGRTSPGGGTH